jgi:DNA-binding beta-propeller fold protein YncE
MKFGLTWGIVLVSICSAQQRHLMLIASKGMPGVTLYNADTEEVICKAKLGLAPHEVAFSANGRTAYVPIYGNTLLGTPGTNEHVVHFLNTRDCRELAAVDTGINTRPHGIAIGKSGKIYLTTEIAETVTIIDPSQQAMTGSIPTSSKYSHMLVVTPDEKTAFVSNVMSKTISVLDLEKKELAKVLEVGSENQRMDLSPDAKHFMTSFWRDSKIAFFRVSDYELDFTVPIDGSALQSKYSADGKYVYAVGTGGPRQIGVWKIDVAERRVVASLKEGVGGSAAAFSINPFTGNLYISDQAAHEVVIVDPKEMKVVKRFAVENQPDAIAFASSR